MNKAYLSLPRRDQQNTLDHAIACLELIEEIWAPLALGAWGGLPEPLRLVLADLINVRQGRRGRLVSPNLAILEW